MRVGVVGINHKLADLKLREKLAKACQKRFGPNQLMHDSHHFVLLSTCNRTEVYFSSEDLATTHIYLLSTLKNEVEEEFDQKLYSYFGINCFTHLTRVAAGLDSAILAETEIQGQVKTAYELAVEYKQLPKELHFLFQKSLCISKKVRTELPLGQGLPSFQNVVFQKGRQFFSNLESVKILFVGASNINQKILSYFLYKDLKNITLCNRSTSQAKALAASHPINILDWNQLNDWQLFDWILFGTKAPDFLVSRSGINDAIRSQLIMDLSVPRNVDPRIGEMEGVTLLNIDQLNLKQDVGHQSQQMIIQAENIIECSVQYQMSRYLQNEQKVLEFSSSLVLP